MAGRPSKYNKEIGEKICLEIATTNKSLKKICEESTDYPTFKTVFNWLNDANNVEFLHSYTRAREAQADILADEILEIADTVKEGKKTKTTGKGDSKTVEETTGDMVERSRLQIDARKFLAAKLKPKKYGDKLDVTTDGKEINNSAVVIYAADGKVIPLARSEAEVDTEKAKT